MQNGSITDWIQLTFAVVGGIYALFLFRKANRERRTERVHGVLKSIYEDADISRILYAVDTNKETAEIRHLGKLERSADKTLRYLDYLGFLIDQDDLTLADLRPFTYEISRILAHKQIQRYIAWLRRIGVKLEYLDRLAPLRSF